MQSCTKSFTLSIAFTFQLMTLFCTYCEHLSLLELPKSAVAALRTVNSFKLLLFWLELPTPICRALPIASLMSLTPIDPIIAPNTRIKKIRKDRTPLPSSCKARAKGQRLAQQKQTPLPPLQRKIAQSPPLLQRRIKSNGS